MNQHTVKFTLPKGGGVKFEVMGGTGESCTLVTKDIELHLNKAGTRMEEGKKPEYYEGGPDINVFNTLGE